MQINNQPLNTAAAVLAHAGIKMTGCEQCPFKDLCGMSTDELKTRLTQNYNRNYMGCRELWPEWKPGLCHKGGVLCAGFRCV